MPVTKGTRPRFTAIASDTKRQPGHPDKWLAKTKLAKENWGRKKPRPRAGAGGLSAGQIQRFSAAQAGLYDFRVVLRDGRAVELPPVDIYVIADVTLADQGLSAR